MSSTLQQFENATDAPQQTKTPWQTPAVHPLPFTTTQTGNSGVVEVDGSTGPLTS